MSLNDLAHHCTVVFSAGEGLASLSGGVLNKEPDRVVRVKLDMFIVTEILTPSDDVVVLVTL